MVESKAEAWGVSLDDMKVRLEEKKWLLRAKQLQKQSESPVDLWEKAKDKIKARHGDKTEDELKTELQIDEEALIDRIHWENWYEVQDRWISADEWKFQPIELKDGLSDHVINYIKSLYDNALPVPSIIFKRDPCLVWTKAKNEKGYAKHNPPKSAPGSTLVHRYIFEAANYELGEATVDHACGKTDCINLRHLRALDRVLNRKYGDHRELDVNQHNK